MMVENMQKQAQFTNLLPAMIGLMILILVVVQVILPQVAAASTINTTANPNISSGTVALAGLLPLLIVVVIVVLVVSLITLKR